MYVPDTVRENDHFERKGMDTDDEWITKNTGIKRRHIASREQSTSDLATNAAEIALAMAELAPDKIGQIVVATATPDMIFPSTACRVQESLKAIHASAYDLSAACSGFIYALAQAYGMHRAGMQDNSLVIGAEIFSTIVDQNDRGTAILFGDGAGAVVVQTVEDPGPAHFVLHADGTKGELLMLPGGGSTFPTSRDTVAAGLHHVQMKGSEVFKEAVERMTEVCIEVLQKAGLTNAEGGVDPRKIDLMVPHQANLRIMRMVGKRLGFPEDKLFSDIEKYGNTSAASIPIAIYDAYHQGKIHRDDTLLMVAFGGGFTWGAGVIQWNTEQVSDSILERIKHRLHR